MREQLSQIDHSDPISKMTSRRSLVYVFATGHSLDAACHLFQVLADALRVKKTLTGLVLNDNPIGDEGVKA